MDVAGLKTEEQRTMLNAMTLLLTPEIRIQIDKLFRFLFKSGF